MRKILNAVIRKYQEIEYDIETFGMSNLEFAIWSFICAVGMAISSLYIKFLLFLVFYIK